MLLSKPALLSRYVVSKGQYKSFRRTGPFFHYRTARYVVGFLRQALRLAALAAVEGIYRFNVE